MPTTENAAIVREIQSQITHVDIKLKAEVLVSQYVKLLLEKRQLQELLNQYR